MRNLKLIIALSVMLMHGFLNAAPCKLLENLPEDLMSNPSFWRDVDLLNKAGKFDDAGLLSVAKKYGHELSPSASSVPKPVDAASRIAPVSSTPQFVMHSGARSSARRLTPGASKKFDQFLEHAQESGGENFLGRLRANQSGWRLEKMRSIKDGYSVRLSLGDRLVFKLQESGVVEILEIGRDTYKH